ncbi:MAG: tRNA guanosine(34) transglycosylase Tgt [Bacteroidales bacterium]|nr:tRNA guanosine(34) transglycosylase Tgt [Bacteroidales bacterium]
MPIHFELQNTASGCKARAGVLHTDHGDIETPIFMPVGTVGSVKGVHIRELEDDVKAQIILGNTYHLFLRPGLETLEMAGGLHQFNGWHHPILTDSGGFQVFSLAGMRKMKEDGVTFQSHIDGSKLMFTPENVIDKQRSIGADIMMAFDECTPGTADKKYAQQSMERTHRWLERCMTRYRETQPKYGYHQALFPIVQGCVYPELRRIAAETVVQYDAEGYAIGGLAVGEPTETMYDMINVVNDILPTQKPRYLMGVGTPANIIESIARGVDMFDCVMPTRNGRNGMLFTRNGIINIRNQKWKNDFHPIDAESNCYVDTQYSLGYLRHLFIAGELLGMQIASIHNLSFYLWLVKEARKHILNDTFQSWYPDILEKITRRL